MDDGELLAWGEEIARAEMADRDKHQWAWGDWALAVAPPKRAGGPRTKEELKAGEPRLDDFRRQLLEKNLEVPPLSSLLSYRSVSKAWPESETFIRIKVSWAIFQVLAGQSDRQTLINKDMTVAKARELVNQRAMATAATATTAEEAILGPSVLPEAPEEIVEPVPDVPVGFIDPESLKTPAAAKEFVKSLPPDVGIALSKAIAADPTARRNVIKDLVQRDTENRQKANDAIRRTAPELAEDADWLALARQMTIIMTAFSKAIELSKVVNITTERRNRLRLMQERIEAASDFLGSWREGGSSSIDDELKALLDNPSSF